MRPSTILPADIDADFFWAHVPLLQARSVGGLMQVSCAQPECTVSVLTSQFGYDQESCTCIQAEVAQGQSSHVPSVVLRAWTQPLY